MRAFLVLALVAALTVGAAAAQMVPLARLSVVASGRVLLDDRQWSDRYVAFYVTDNHNRAQCFMVLTDTKTQFFTTTLVDASSCAAK